MIDKFRRDGTPYPEGDEGLFEWARDMEKPGAKRVAETTLWWGGWISTVWLGLDNSFSMRPHKPLIFETMVFFHGYSDIDMARYSTETEAIEGHKAMVRKWTIPYGFLDNWFSSIGWKIRRLFRK